MRSLDGAPPSSCELRGEPDGVEEELLAAVRALLESASDGARYQAANLAWSMLHSEGGQPDASGFWPGCLFKHAAAMVLLEAEFPGESGIHDDQGNWVTRLRSAHDVLRLGAHQGPPGRFFWDLFATPWPVWQLLAARLRPRLEEVVGKGQMGSALMGSLQI